MPNKDILKRRETDRQYRERCKLKEGYTEKNRKYHREYNKKWRMENPQRQKELTRRTTHTEYHKQYSKEYYQKNKERLRLQKQEYYQNNKQYFKIKSNEHYKQNKKTKQLIWQIKRRQVLEHYGNKCQCCGESEAKFLAMDHINNDGNMERKTRTINIFDFLIRNNFPDTFQILCHNCNLSKAFYGSCPHRDV